MKIFVFWIEFWFKSDFFPGALIDYIFDSENDLELNRQYIIIWAEEYLRAISI